MAQVLTEPSNTSERDSRVAIAVRELNQIHLGSAARRLQSLNDALSDNVVMGKLANVNVYGAFDPAEIEKRATDEALRENSSLIGTLEWIRNVLVLVPITLTWFSFWLAAQDYGALLRANPEMAGESFLYLWETGFAGEALLPFLTFSQTALIAAFVLLIIIFLTFIVHYRKDVASTHAENEAARIRADVEDALWEIEKSLSTRRRSDTDVGVAEDLHQAVTQFNVVTDKMGRAVTQMDGGAREWMNITKEIDLRLGMVVGEMREEADGLRVFSNGLTGNVDTMFKHLESASRTSNQLSIAIEKLSGSIQANTVVQEDRLNDIAAQLNVMEEQARGWGQALRKTSDDLRIAVDKSTSSVASVAGAVVTVTAVLKGQDELRAAIQSLEQTFASAGAGSRGGGLGGTDIRQSLDALAKMNADIAREQNGLLTQIRNEISQGMRTLVNDQSQFARAMQEQNQWRSGPVEANIKIVPLAFAIGVSVVVASMIVVAAWAVLSGLFTR